MRDTLVRQNPLPGFELAAVGDPDGDVVQSCVGLVEALAVTALMGMQPQEQSDLGLDKDDGPASVVGLLHHLVKPHQVGVPADTGLQITHAQ